MHDTALPHALNIGRDGEKLQHQTAMIGGRYGGVR